MSVIGSWIAKGVVEHDRIHGSNLDVVRTGRKWMVQITKFHTYRTPDNPRAQITGLISDKTHTVPVAFDVDFTDEFEREKPDLEVERLTQNLRAIMTITSFRWRIESPRGRTAQGLEMPTLKMEILEWSIHLSGDLPVLYENAVEVGFGKDDGAAQKVLRKWYFGESHSDMSEVEKSFERSQPEAGPSRLTMSSPMNAVAQQGSRLPQGVITLTDFLEPYLSENGAKKGKPIPDWLFETSKADQDSLDGVNYFGLEYDANNDHVMEEPVAAEGSSPDVHEDELLPTRADKGKGKERAPSVYSSPPRPIASKASAVTTFFQTQTPPVPLAQHVTSTQQFNLTQSPLADNEESESDGEIPVVPPRRVEKRKSRVMFDPLAFPQSSGESVAPVQAKEKEVEQDAGQEDEAMELSNSEADSEDLSDYEREARQQRKRKRSSPIRKEVRNAPKTQSQPPTRDAPIVLEDESIPASESIESLSLTKRYPSPGKTAASPIDLTSSFVQSQGAVDHGVHSLGKDSESQNSKSNEHSNESSLPTPPPSDHGPGSQDSVGDSARTEVRPVVPKIEHDTVGEHRRTKSKSSVSTPKVERDVSRSSRTEVAHADQVVVSEVARPFERRSRSRMDQPGPSTAANITLAQSIQKATYTLDLSVDGLTTEEVKQYTEKVKATRAKLRPS